MSTAQKTLVIGHRGAMGHATENTLASIEKALNYKVDMIEIDVFVLKTGELVVFHDDTLDRITDHKGKIEDYSFDQLRKVLVEGQHQIPTLEEVIDKIDRKAVLNIELKGAHTAIPTYKVIQEYIGKGWKNEHFIVSSFRWDELELFSKEKNPVGIAILTAEDPVKAIEFAEKIKAFAINPHYKWLWTDSVEALKKAGLKIYPWTVNEASDIARLIELQVDGIITNYPERVK